jgi:precorrin-6B methylase 2
VEKGRFAPPRPETKEPAWSSPVLAGGMLYLRDQDDLLCYDLRKDRTAPSGSVAVAAPVLPGTRVAAVADAGAAGTGAAEAPRRDGHGRDAVFVPTPQDVVERMLELAAVGKGDVVYDLGCGDGRIVVTAAKRYGCKAAGFDIDPQCVRLSLENADRQGVADRVKILDKDLFDVDLAEASVVTLYLGREVNRRLVPQLQKLKPGSRVVSHNFDIEGLRPDKVVEFSSAEDDTKHTLYLWTAPLKPKKTQ